MSFNFFHGATHLLKKPDLTVRWEHTYPQECLKEIKELPPKPAQHKKNITVQGQKLTTKNIEDLVGGTTITDADKKKQINFINENKIETLMQSLETELENALRVNFRKASLEGNYLPLQKLTDISLGLRKCSANWVKQKEKVKQKDEIKEKDKIVCEIKLHIFSLVFAGGIYEIKIIGDDQKLMEIKSVADEAMDPFDLTLPFNISASENKRSSVNLSRSELVFAEGYYSSTLSNSNNEKEESLEIKKSAAPVKYSILKCESLVELEMLGGKASPKITKFKISSYTEDLKILKKDIKKIDDASMDQIHP